MDKKFHSLNKLLQVILLLLPFVNWITEIVVRWSAFLKKGGFVRLLVSLIVTFLGIVIGWLDAIWVLITNKLICE